MNYILEAILVGFYEMTLYFIFSQFITNFYILLLVVGFSKHFLGKLLGIHTWYCNNGSACINTLTQKQKYIANSIHFLRTSFGEAIAHLFLGLLLVGFLGKIYVFFVIGIILHIAAESLGIHNNFCRESCDKREYYH
jgi:hypothetical protein